MWNIRRPAKSIDTADHDILLAKLNHYDICGVSNEWFRSYLSNQQQYVAINGDDSGLTKINCGVPKGYVLEALLFSFFDIDMTVFKP